MALSGNLKSKDITRLLLELSQDVDAPFLSNTNREESLEKLKVYGRDPVDAGPIHTPEGIAVLAKQAFLPDSSSKARRDALSCIANSLLLQEQCRNYLADQDCWTSLIEVLRSSESHDQFLAARILFILTYVDQGALFKAVVDAHPLIVAIHEKLTQHAARCAKDRGTSASSVMDDNALTEITKLIFNITNFLPLISGKFSASIPHLFVIATSIQKQPPLSPPISSTLNALLNLDISSPEWTSHAHDTSGPKATLPALTAILDTSIPAYTDNDLNTLVTPVIALFSKIYASAPEPAKAYLQQSLLPSEQDRQHVLGHSDSLASRLLRLSNSPSAPMLASAIAQLLFELSASDPDVFVRNVGLGYASGYLVSNGLPLPSTAQEGSDDVQAGDDNAASSTGTGARLAFNPVTGQRRDQERAVNDDELPPMTEEEKEREAERLFVLFERLKATGVIDVRNPVEDAHRFEELPD